MANARVNGDVLRWAREKAGLSHEEAAARAPIGRKKGMEPADRLAAMERGEEAVSHSCLRNLAKLYRRPLVTFYLAKPPAPDTAIPDFRTLADAPIHEVSPNLDALLRRLRARQQEVREIRADDGAVPLPFIGRFNLQTAPSVIAADIRDEIDLNLAAQRRFPDRDAFFRGLRRKLEDIGIFVQLFGDLGSHHSRILPEEFRGLVLLDDLAPFIVINPNDAAAAFLFTLLHEVAHIWIGEGGISNSSPFESGAAANATEQLCNKVAAEFLVPGGPILADWRALAPELTVGQKVQALASSWRVSRAMMARRLRELRQITEDDWWRLYRGYQQEWRAQRERLQEQEGGPGWYLLATRKIGNGLINTVLGALDNGTVTYTEASRILGVKSKNFSGLRERAL